MELNLSLIVLISVLHFRSSANACLIGSASISLNAKINCEPISSRHRLLKPPTCVPVCESPSILIPSHHPAVISPFACLPLNNNINSFSHPAASSSVSLPLNLSPVNPAAISTVSLPLNLSPVNPAAISTVSLPLNLSPVNPAAISTVSLPLNLAPVNPANVACGLDPRPILTQCGQTTMTANCCEGRRLSSLLSPPNAVNSLPVNYGNLANFPSLPSPIMTLPQQSPCATPGCSSPSSSSASVTIPNIILALLPPKPSEREQQEQPKLETTCNGCLFQRPVYRPLSISQCRRDEEIRCVSPFPITQQPVQHVFPISQPAAPYLTPEQNSCVLNRINNFS